MPLTPRQLEALQIALQRLADDLTDLGAPRSVVRRADEALKAVDYARKKQ